MPQRALRDRDDAVSDQVGTLLLVLAVVVAGAGLAVVVTSALSRPAASDASVALEPVAAGDASVFLRLRHGDVVPLDVLRATLSRNGSIETEVDRAAWSAPAGDALDAGERLGLPLSPAATAGETVRLRLYRTDVNALVVDLVQRVPDAATAPRLATLAASFAPASVPADGATPALLAVRVSHPDGALAVARVEADLRNLSRAGGTANETLALNDLGLDGDAQGGDGVWSAFVRVPSTVPAALYVVTVNATDTAGRAAGTTVATLVAASGDRAMLGTSFAVPTSQNITSMRLRNFTTDRNFPLRLDGDYALVRIVDRAGNAWSLELSFEDVAGVAYVTELRVWNQANETVYTPRNGSRMPVAGLDLDVLRPVESLQWVRWMGAAHPNSLYPASRIGDGAYLSVFRLGDSNSNKGTDTGLFAMDVVIR